MTDTPRRGPPAPAPVTQERKSRAPVTRVKSGGRINRRLQELQTLFERNNPGRSVRWVYDPQHKPDLSNVLSRQVDGFVMAYVKDLGESMALPGMKPDDPVRVGDTVMMHIAEAEAQEMRADLNRAASDEMTRVDQEFQAAVDEITHTKAGKEYKPRPLGTSLTEEVEREVEGPDTHKE